MKEIIEQIKNDLKKSKKEYKQFFTGGDEAKESTESSESMDASIGNNKPINVKKNVSILALRNVLGDLVILHFVLIILIHQKKVLIDQSYQDVFLLSLFLIVFFSNHLFLYDFQIKEFLVHSSP